MTIEKTIKTKSFQQMCKNPQYLTREDSPKVALECQKSHRRDNNILYRSQTQPISARALKVHQIAG